MFTYPVDSIPTEASFQPLLNPFPFATDHSTYPTPAFGYVTCLSALMMHAACTPHPSGCLPALAP